MEFLIILLGLLPSFAWLIFFLKEDVHPEPKKMIGQAFIAGALTTFVVIGFQLLLRDFLKFFSIHEYSVFAFLGMGLIEEVFKFLAAYLVVRKSRFFDEPIDAMIYIITAALGFAMIENIAVMSNIKILSEAIGIITLRFVGATLLHALSSGTAGYYWAKGLVLKNQFLVVDRWSLVIKGIVFAALLHAIFNYLIMVSKGQILIYPTIFLIIIALFLFWDFERIKRHNTNIRMRANDTNEYE